MKATRALHDVLELHKNVLQSISDGVHVIGLDGRVLFENRAAADMLGWCDTCLDGFHSHDRIHHKRRDGSPFPEAECPIHLSLKDGEPREVQGDMFWRKDGSGVPVDYRTTPLKDRNGAMYGVAVVFKDATERERRERYDTALRTVAEAAYIAETYSELLEKTYQALKDEVSLSSMRLWVYGGLTGELRCRAAGETPPQEVVRQLDSFSEQYSEGGAEHRLASVAPGWLGGRLYCSHRPVGMVAFGLRAEAAKLDKASYELVEFANTQLALGTSRLLRQESLQHAAHHDALTGLPNRVLLNDRIASAIAQAERRGEGLAVAYMDLDGFKPVNDSMGHFAGDELLRLVAERLGGALRATDTLARVGGDEFVVLLTQVNSPRAAESAAKKLTEALEEPFEVLGAAVKVGASLGLALWPSAGSDPESLVRSADEAMYDAKRLKKLDLRMGRPSQY